MIINIDGGARGNPGVAGFGVYVQDEDGGPAAELFGFLGIQTNNVAEYAALIVALRHAVRHQAASVIIRSDSQLLVRQMTGEYRVKNPGLIPMNDAARRLAARLPRVAYEHVPRERNRDADRLANVAMDTRAEDPIGVSKDLPLPRSL